MKRVAVFFGGVSNEHDISRAHGHDGGKLIEERGL